MADSDNPTPHAVVVAGRLLEAFVFAPIGAGAKLVTDGPGAVARARQELANARFIGQMVVGQGTAQLKQRLEQRSDEPESSADRDVVSGDSVSSDRSAPSAGATDEPPVLVVEQSAGELAIPDYDHLPAIDIVEQLESLTAAELDEVDAYERANRRRRTVLGKIAQLTAAT